MVGDDTRAVSTINRLTLTLLDWQAWHVSSNKASNNMSTVAAREPSSDYGRKGGHRIQVIATQINDVGS
jgi:hypothetical protein